MAFGELTQKYSANNGGAQAFCDGHQDFCVSLANYLIGEEALLSQENIERCAMSMQTLLQHPLNSVLRDARKSRVLAAIDSIPGGFDYSFLVFNYTQIIDKVVDLLRSRNQDIGSRTARAGTTRNSFGTVIHPHGTVMRNMVLGVADEGQIANRELFENEDRLLMAQIIKSLTDEMNEENIGEHAINTINESDLIIIYGMSLGATDKNWWETICKRVAACESSQVIIYDDEAKDLSLIRTRFLQKEIEIRKKLLKYCNLTREEVESVSERIHLMCVNPFEDIRDCVHRDEENKRLANEFRPITKEEIEEILES